MITRLQWSLCNIAPREIVVKVGSLQLTCPYFRPKKRDKTVKMMVSTMDKRIEVAKGKKQVKLLPWTVKSPGKRPSGRLSLDAAYNSPPTTTKMTPSIRNILAIEVSMR